MGPTLTSLNQKDSEILMYHLLAVWIHHQPVVNDPVHDEQHCKNDKSDAVLLDDYTQLIESEVAEDAEERTRCV